MKRWIEEKGTVSFSDGLSRRELYRVAVEGHLIQSVEEWMEFHAARNNSSHLYDANTASEVLLIAKKYLSAGKMLFQFLEQHND